MKKSITKYLLAGIFFFLLWAPVLQDKLHVFKGGELKGAFTKPEDIDFSFENWFNGSYAAKKEEFIRSSFGFHADLIRLYNQIEFSVFKIAGTNNVAVGKGDYLYEQPYIDSYYGTDFLGDSAIENRAKDLKQLQDSLQNHGVFLFMVFAPGKGSFFPEYIPDNKRRKLGRTNFHACIAACNKVGLNYIDFKSYFEAMKDTSHYRLFPRGGMHWSYYGDVLAFDSIIHYLHQKAGYAMPQFKIDSFQTSKIPLHRDNDAGDALNLIWQPYNRDTLTYPCFSVSGTSKKLNFMTIGDSFYWMMHIYMSPLVFKDCSFWYYFNGIDNPKNPYVEPTDAHNQLKKIVLSQNIICIMQTDGGLSNFGLGFAEEANKKFKLHE